MAAWVRFTGQSTSSLWCSRLEPPSTPTMSSLADTAATERTSGTMQAQTRFGSGRLDELSMHPTIKPVALIADAIKDASKRSETVLDPFCGSGSTIIAAEKTGRQACGLEIDPKYIDVAVRRWQLFTGKSAVLDGTTASFEEVTEQRNNLPAIASAPQPEPRELKDVG